MTLSPTRQHSGHQPVTAHGRDQDLAACRRKIRHKSRAEAKNHARKLKREGSPGWEYECGHCGGWHVSTMNKQDRRGMVRRSAAHAIADRGNTEVAPAVAPAMGKAYQPPKSNRESRYYITQHAVERFRERVSEEHHALSARDLALLLDDRLHGAILAKQSVIVTDRECPNEPTTVAWFEDRQDRKTFVVLRKRGPGQYGTSHCVVGPGVPALCAITALTPDMAAQRYRDGHWRASTNPFASLAAVRPEPVPTIAIPVPEPVVVPADPPLALVPPNSERGASPRGGNNSEARTTYDARVAMARELIAADPQIKMYGAVGIYTQVRAKFGTGLSHAVMLPLYSEVSGQKAELVPAPAPVVPVAPVEAVPVQANSPYSVPAQELADAIADERSARARYATAAAEYSAASDAVLTASARVQTALDRITALRAD